MKINKERRRFLLALPVIAWPFLCFTFSRLGGGTDNGVEVVRKGLNPELPGVKPDPKQVFLDKLKLYDKAEHDSIRKEQYQRQDPYRQDTVAVLKRDTFRLQRSKGLAPMRPAGDPRAEQLLAQLERLKQGLKEPATRAPAAAGFLPHHEEAGVGIRGRNDTAGDSRMGQLNEMLDKVIRIQHPEERRAPVESRRVDAVLPADPTANMIAATIPADQTLTTGTTISLRLTDSISVSGRVLPGGQLVYGVVSIANDRMLVHVTGLREGDRLYSTDLQVYDLDGIAGIHIPAELSRDVAKQSADQGVNSLNVLNVDPSVGAQAAAAGIQTVKAFVGRKVRQVRVSVRAGYQVLLRNAQERIRDKEDSISIRYPLRGIRPPGFDPDGPILSHFSTEGLELALRGVWLDQGLLWFGMDLKNEAAIAYTPAYVRWYIRDRRKLRRTAMQEVPLEPLVSPGLVTVGGNSAVHCWTGFRPFAIGKDKELVVEIGEKDGGRTLVMAMDHRMILRAKSVSP